MKFGDSIAKGGKGTTDLTITTLMHRDSIAFVILVLLQCVYDELAPAVLKLNAKVRDHLSVKGLKRYIKFDFVHFRFDKFGVSHAVSEVAVIGKKE